MEFKYEGKSESGGVYKMSNLSNGRVYYGSAKEFKSRWKAHERSLKNNKHSNKFLQADFNKCGTSTFIFEIVEVIQGTKEDRLLREQIYIDLNYDNNVLCYNLKKKANCSNGHQHNLGRKHTEEAKAKMSAANKGKKHTEEHKAKIAAALIGHSVSSETKSKIASSNKENRSCLQHKLHDQPKTTHTAPAKAKESSIKKGKKHTDETKAKIAASHRGMKYSDETKAKISAIHKGKKTSDETKAKISKANRGKKRTDETKAKMSAAKKEKGVPMK